MTNDPFNLARFLLAQEDVYETALEELRGGQKRSHWMWFIFPQLRDLGRSSTARLYGLSTIEEAKAYWNHRVLGPRLRECVDAMLHIKDRSAAAVLGEVDALKLRSCLTLFREVAPADAGLNEALERYYSGQPDGLTLRLLEGHPGKA